MRRTQSDSASVLTTGFSDLYQGGVIANESNGLSFDVEPVFATHGSGRDVEGLQHVKSLFYEFFRGSHTVNVPVRSELPSTGPLPRAS